MVASEWVAPLRDATGRAIPGRSWEGSVQRKPWEYRVTAAIVHLDTPELLAAVVATLRAQTERPYILVVDTGSHAPGRAAVEAVEAEDLEVIFLRPRAWRCTSEPVSVAMDCAFARCQTELLYATHVDVFLKRADFVEWLAGQCDARTPAVGYQMSPRPAWGHDLWRSILSHTATCYHMPTMRRLGALWSMTAAFERLDMEVVQPYHTGWPDTEANLGLTLRDAGIGVRWPGDRTPGQNEPPSVLMIGTERNEPYEDDNLEHVRSTTSHTLYNGVVAADRESLLRSAVERSAARVAAWGIAEPRPAPEAPTSPRPLFMPGDPRAEQYARQRTALAIANTCPHRSRPNWHARCRAGKGGIDPHFVVTGDDCAACPHRGVA